MGLAYLKQNQPERALPILRQVGSPLRQQAIWYQALALLQADQRSKAQAILKRISRTPGHPYQSEARTLLQQLSSLP